MSIPFFVCSFSNGTRHHFFWASMFLQSNRSKLPGRQILQVPQPRFRQEKQLKNGGQDGNFLWEILSRFSKWFFPTLKLTDTVIYSTKINGCKSIYFLLGMAYFHLFFVFRECINKSKPKLTDPSSEVKLFWQRSSSFPNESIRVVIFWMCPMPWSSSYSKYPTNLQIFLSIPTGYPDLHQFINHSVPRVFFYKINTQLNTPVKKTILKKQGPLGVDNALRPPQAKKRHDTVISLCHFVQKKSQQRPWRPFDVVYTNLTGVFLAVSKWKPFTITWLYDQNPAEVMARLPFILLPLNTKASHPRNGLIGIIWQCNDDSLLYSLPGWMD